MKSRSTFTSRRHTSRQASILVCVLVCLAVATALVTSTVQTALTARRAMRTQHHLRQTELLLAAGIQRAALQVQSVSEYSGETWKLSPNTIPGIETAQVKIDVVPIDGELPSEVHVTARLLITEHISVQRSYSFPVDPQLSSDKE
jgi:hypothetical protein